MSTENDTRELVDLTDPLDPYSWRCKCGNTPDAGGFYPCLEDGTEVEPVKDGPWQGSLYLCGDCGWIIDQTEPARYAPMDGDTQPCCDGTGWTGNERERCPEHYTPLPWPWGAR